MKRICCFCESWESGGIESFLASVYTHADLSELEIDIVTSKLLDSVFTARLEKLGIRFYQLSGSQRRLLTNHAMFRRLLRERHYDVLHINAFQSLSLYYAKLAMQAGVPVRIAHSHNTALRKSPLRWAKMLLHRMGRQYLGRYATALWACSRDAANFLFSQRATELEHIRCSVGAEGEIQHLRIVVGIDLVVDINVVRIGLVVFFDQRSQIRLIVTVRGPVRDGDHAVIAASGRTGSRAAGTGVPTGGQRCRHANNTHDFKKIAPVDLFLHNISSSFENRTFFY